MPTYRRPGVYLEESTFSNSSETGTSATTTLFVGACERGPTMENVTVGSWADYSSTFGDFAPAPGTFKSFLPYAVHNYFQNGGRGLTIRRAISTGVGTGGTAATYTVVEKLNDVDPVVPAFTLTAKSAGVWGNELRAEILIQDDDAGVYTLRILRADIAGNLRVVETFRDLVSTEGISYSLKTPIQAVNDEINGSKLVTASDLDPDITPTALGNTPSVAWFDDGDEPGAPSTVELAAATAEAVGEVYGSVLLYVSGHYESTEGELVNSSYQVAESERLNVFLIQDGAPPRLSTQSSSAYATALETNAVLGTSGLNRTSSQVANYTPWILIPSPTVVGSTQLTPPGGAVAGVISRMDYSGGAYRSPAGISASLSNVINLDAKYPEGKLADLNSKNINVIRSVVGNGVCIMGGRTLKNLGVDRFITARRTLINIEQQLQDATQFAVFENNDDILWSRLRAVAERILRPIWSLGGLRGETAADAYFITCDASINTPQVVSSGEVRMEIGVSLEYPAEFVVIRLSQFDGGSAVRTSII